MAALPPKAELDGSSVGHNQGVFKAAVGGVRDFLAGLFGSTGNREDAIDALRALDPLSIFNLSLVPTVGANALTVNIKTRAGAAPSAADPVMIGQRSVTPSAGDFNLRKITAAVALTVSSGSTLGHGNSDSRYIYWYLIDFASAQELAVSSKFFGASGIVSTTAEGGAGAADSATVMYSATTRSNVPFRCVGRMQAPQTIAGTWASLPTRIDLPIDSDDAVPAENSYVQGVFGLSGDISPAQITANQHDYNPTGLSTASVLRLSTDASRDVTGLVGGSDGRIVTKLNIGSFPIVLKNENAGSAAANRFVLDSDVLLQPGHGITLIYDSTSSRWRPVGSPFKRQGTTSVAKGLYANLASAASVSILATEIQLTDTNGNTFVATNVNVTPSLATAGANGLDTGAEAANTWYYGWIIAKPDGTVAGLFSTSFTAPVMPSGYTFKAVVGAYRNDSGSNLLNFNQFGSTLYWLTEINILNAGTATVETGVSLATATPPEAADFIASARLDCTSDASGNVGGTLFLRWGSGANYLSPFCNTEAQSANASGQTLIGTFQFRAPNNANNIFYHSTLTAGTAPQASIWVQGFRLKGVGGE